MSSSPQRWYHKWSWYDPNEIKEERRLLLKQDFMILTFGCLTFFTKVPLPPCHGQHHPSTNYSNSSSISKHFKMLT